MIIWVTAPGYGNDTPILAEPMDNGFVRISGKQLLVVSEPKDRKLINHEAVYYLHRVDYDIKHHDCVCFTEEFSKKLSLYGQGLDHTYMMRVDRYCPSTGRPMVHRDELVRAGVSKDVAEALTEYNNGYTKLQPRIIRYV